MEFIKELKKQNVEIGEYNSRYFYRLKTGNYYISIQASSGHYCTPRESLKDLDLYTSMEIALFKKNYDWLHINRSVVLKKFSRYNELIEHSDGLDSSAPVFGYVPIDLINDLYLYLININ